ncbi:hypothetical protein ACOSQ3_015800 [Xanthoceras sorbifolium]
MRTRFAIGSSSRTQRTRFMITKRENLSKTKKREKKKRCLSLSLFLFKFKTAKGVLFYSIQFKFCYLGPVAAHFSLF